MQTVTTPTISLEEARDYLNALDLHYIITSMCAATYPLPRWTAADAEHCCQLYKNYLWLVKKHPEQALVPTREIDEFWHNHILYTQQYARDCRHIFGHYLHHTPTPPDEDPQTVIAQYLITKQLYFAEFKQHLNLISSERHVN